MNMALSERLGLHDDTYSVSIPLGATINMAGAAITVRYCRPGGRAYAGDRGGYSDSHPVECGGDRTPAAHRVWPGGSLLLIPLACSLFGIERDCHAGSAVGFIIGILQDSAETALNSSTDVLFTAAACMAKEDQSLQQG